MEVANQSPSAVATVGPQKRNRIQVSTHKKPLYFYVNLAKRYMQQHNEIELSALGMAIGTVVMVAEILKNNGLATEKKILTSTVGTKDESNGRLIRKSRIEILLGKTDKFDDLVTRAKAAEHRSKVELEEKESGVGEMNQPEKSESSKGVAEEEEEEEAKKE